MTVSGFTSRTTSMGRWKATGQRPDEPPVEPAQVRAFDLAVDADELLAKDVLGDQGCPRRDESRTRPNKKRSRAITVLSAHHDTCFRGVGDRAGADVQELAARCRSGYVSIGETGADPARRRNICAPQVPDPFTGRRQACNSCRKTRSSRTVLVVTEQSCLRSRALACSWGCSRRRRQCSSRRRDRIARAV